MSKYLNRAVTNQRRTNKLSEEDIRPIRERIAAGDQLKDIALDYKVSSTSIGAIRSGQTWVGVGLIGG